MSDSAKNQPRVQFVHELLRARHWQGRPEFDQVSDWWRSGPCGVCALVGDSGTGKTAIVERLFQTLPRILPEHANVPKGTDSATSQRLFVFSFHNAPNTDSFFTELAAWIQSDSPSGKPSYLQTIERLTAAGSCVLMLDGCENVQSDGTRHGTFGRIRDGRLRDLVLRTADGSLANLSLLVTSRFRLSDAQMPRVGRYQQIDVETLSPVAAVRLLRDRGVKCGTEEQLEQIAHEYGFHALSVDLIGGYIFRFCSGDPTRFALRKQAQRASKGNGEHQPDIAAVRKHGQRLTHHLVNHFCETLSKADPAALGLLQRLCLFHAGADAGLLTALFTGDDKAKISGPMLAALDQEQIVHKLHWLAEMGLTAEQQPADESCKQTAIKYRVNAAVRDGFLAHLNATQKSLGHVAIRERLITSLGGLPGVASPSDSQQLDALEEIILHTLESGDACSAWNLYENALGGYRNLGHRLAENERGCRICSAIADAHRRDSQGCRGLPLPWLMCELGHYLLNLGCLSACADRYRQSLSYFAQKNDLYNASTVSMTMSMLATHRGRLADAVARAGDAAGFALRSSWKCEAEARMYGIYADTLRGNLTRALTELQALNAYPLADEDRLIDREKFGMWRVSLLTHLGRLRTASELAVAVILDCVERWGSSNQYANICGLLLGNIKCRVGELNVAQKLANHANEWALAHDSSRALCLSAILQTKIHLEHICVANSPVDRRSVMLGRAQSTIEAGLRIATACGFGINHIDLLLLRAQLALHEGRTTDALRDITIALDEGVHPNRESGLPTLLAATDTECGYAWGEVAGRQLRGEAYLLQAAQENGRAEFDPTRFQALPPTVRDLVATGRKQLEAALDLWRELKDPDSPAEFNPQAVKTEQTLKQLQDGRLTKYRLFEGDAGE